jgi:hypothetical protein
MKSFRLSLRRPAWLRPVLLVLALPLGIVACRETKVAQYRIPKEADTPAPAAAAPVAGTNGPAVAVVGANELEWTAPAAWVTKPLTAMRKGSYAVGGDAGADLAITAFPGDVGGDLANVNRWRGQLQLPPISEADLPAAFSPLTANGLALKVVDLAGGGQRMLGAIVPHGGATWFFKLSGPEVVVAQAKPAYLEFLQSVRASAPRSDASPVVAAAAPDMTAMPIAKADGPGLKWTAPAHWQEKPATAMRKATYIVPGAGGASAELAVTAFPGDVGGELANVNRWRGQLQLPPLVADGLPAAVSRIPINDLTITLVDLTGGPAENPQRLLGAIVPHGGSTWFFKLTGPAALVTAEQPAFRAFLQTLSAP